jgi:hypothetical protein
MSETVIDNPPYEPPPGGADVCPPVVLEEPPDPEVVALMDETALPPDPRDPPPEELVPVDAPTNVDVPVILGVGALGEVLSCTMGNWTGEPTSYAWQWLSADMPVGTGGDTYVIADTDQGNDITCMVTAFNAAGSAQAPPSNAVSVPPGAAREA